MSTGEHIIWTSQTCREDAMYVCIVPVYGVTLYFAYLLHKILHFDNTILNYIDSERVIVRFLKESMALNRATSLVLLFQRLKLATCHIVTFDNIPSSFLTQCNLNKITQFNKDVPILEVEKLNKWIPYFTYIKAKKEFPILTCSSCHYTPCFVMCVFCSGSVAYSCRTYFSSRDVFSHNCKCKIVTCNTCNGIKFNPLKPMIIHNPRHEVCRTSDTSCVYREENKQFYLVNGKKEKQICLCEEWHDCHYFKKQTEYFHDPKTIKCDEQGIEQSTEQRIEQSTKHSIEQSTKHNIEQSTKHSIEHSTEQHVEQGIEQTVIKIPFTGQILVLSNLSTTAGSGVVTNVLNVMHNMEATNAICSTDVKNNMSIKLNYTLEKNSFVKTINNKLFVKLIFDNDDDCAVLKLSFRVNEADDRTIVNIYQSLSYNERQKEVFIKIFPIIPSMIESNNTIATEFLLQLFADILHYYETNKDTDYIKTVVRYIQHYKSI